MLTIKALDKLSILDYNISHNTLIVNVLLFSGKKHQRKERIGLCGSQISRWTSMGLT